MEVIQYVLQERKNIVTENKTVYEKCWQQSKIHMINMYKRNFKRKKKQFQHHPKNHN